jgi:hypothetical protein
MGGEMPQHSRQADFQVRPAEDSWKDAEGIARGFNTTYSDYPFPEYTDPEQVREQVLPAEGSHNFVVEVHDGQEVDGYSLEEPRVIGTGSVKLQEGGTVAELGGAVIEEMFRGLREPAGESAYQRLFDTRRQHAYDAGADVVLTQTVSSTHAKTQYQAAKDAFVPTGVSDKKYPEVFQGEKRETTVPMVDAHSNFWYTESADETPQVFVNEDTAALVDHVYSSFNAMRDEGLDRDMVFVDEGDYGPEDLAEQGFQVKEKAVDDEVARLAQYQILPGGDQSFEEVHETVVSAVGNEDYDWVGVDLDANHAYAGEMASYLQEAGFDMERYVPEELDYHDDGPRDALGFQYRPDETNQIQLLEDVMETADVMGLEYKEKGGPDLDHVMDVAM